MIKKISKIEAFKEKMAAEGKQTYLDNAQNMSAITSMNSQLQVIRREYQVKERSSQKTASSVILSA